MVGVIIHVWKPKSYSWTSPQQILSVDSNVSFITLLSRSKEAECAAIKDVCAASHTSEFAVYVQKSIGTLHDKIFKKTITPDDVEVDTIHNETKSDTLVMFLVAM